MTLLCRHETSTNKRVDMSPIHSGQLRSALSVTLLRKGPTELVLQGKPKRHQNEAEPN